MALVNLREINTWRSTEACAPPAWTCSPSHVREEWGVLMIAACAPCCKLDALFYCLLVRSFFNLVSQMWFSREEYLKRFKYLKNSNNTSYVQIVFKMLFHVFSFAHQITSTWENREIWIYYIFLVRSSDIKIPAATIMVTTGCVTIEPTHVRRVVFTL